jgi:hypothetical protein
MPLSLINSRNRKNKTSYRTDPVGMQELAVNLAKKKLEKMKGYRSCVRMRVK